MLHRLLVIGAWAALAGTSTLACGDDKVAPQQAVVSFGLGTPSGGSCSSAKSYQFPDGARATVSGGTGVGERVKDGSDDLVECEVRLASGSTTSYDVNLRFQGGEVGNLVVSGTLTDAVAPASDGTVTVTFNTAQFGLAQNGCSVEIKKLLPGAIWMSNLHCDNLRDPSSPGIACDGLGGVIFENCSH